FITYALTGGSTNTPCTSATLSANPASGSAVTLTASATGCATPEYQYYYLAPGASAYKQIGTANSWGGASLSWPTTGLTAGSYTLGVLARAQGSTAAYQTYQFITYA